MCIAFILKGACGMWIAVIVKGVCVNNTHFEKSV
jgi:hypothetical protein